MSGCVVSCGLPPGHYYIFPGVQLTGSCDLFPSDDGQREAPNNGGRGRRGTHCDHSGIHHHLSYTEVTLVALSVWASA